MARCFSLAGIIVLALVLTAPALAADCLWSGANGNWDDPSQWSDCGGGIPGSVDTAIIGAGTVNLQATTTVAGLTMTGGTLIGNGLGMSLTVNDSLLLTGEAPKRIARMTLNNGGAAVWNEGNFTLGPWPDPVNFNNLAGASFEIVGERKLQPSGGSALLNAGAIIKSGPGLANLDSALGVRNDGLIRIEEGALRIQGTRSIPVEVFTHSGDFEMLAGATMQFDGTQNFGPTASITGDGNVSFIRSGGAFVLDHDMTYNIGGRTTLWCFSCAVRLHATAVTGELALIPWFEGVFAGHPQLEGEGSVTVTGQTIWQQGVIGHTGPHNGQITVEMQGGLDLQAGTSRMAGGVILRNHGEAVFSGGDFFISWPTAHFFNLPGATFTFPGPRDVNYRWGGGDEPLGRFINQGTLVKEGAGYATFTGIILENSGAIEAQSGGLAFRRVPAGSNPTGGRLVLLADSTTTAADEPIRIEENGWLLGRGVIDGPVWVEGHISPGHPGFGGTPWEVARISVNGDLGLDFDGRYLAKLLSGTTPGLGHDQVAVDGRAFVDGLLQISLSPDYNPPMGSEFTLLTCSQGCIGFFNELVVNPADSYFQLLYLGDRIVARRVNEPPLPEDPIVGLQAASTAPAFVGETVLFAAAVAEGQSVLYRWDFDDGLTLYGSHVERSYADAGFFSATVTALNPVSSASVDLSVTINERPNFAGRVWHDLDGDGQPGLGEAGLANATVTAVGPGGNLQATSDGDGLWRIDEEAAGLYELAALFGGFQPTTPNPLSLPLPQAGSALVDFGLIEAAPPGQARISGRVWADADADGLADPTETPFANHPVSLWQSGAQLASITADSDGLFAFDGLAPGSYEIRADAPAAHFPSSISAELTLAGGQHGSAMLGFLPGGTIGGRVRNPADVGQPNIVIALDLPGGVNLDSTVTGSNGSYQFGPLAPGSYTLRLLPPPDYFPEDGVLSRSIELGSGFNPQDWTVNRLGRLGIYARANWFTIGDFPVGGLAFNVAHEGGSSSEHVTGPDGRITLDGLPPGVYTVTPLAGTAPANSVINPASRTAVVADNTFAQADFSVLPDQSVRTICIRGLTNPPGAGFPCTVEVRALIDGQAADPPVYTAFVDSRYHLVLGLATGSYEVALIPDEANWPVYRENVVLDAGSSPIVNYPYNPSPSVTDIRGYAYLDSNASQTRQCGLGECNDPAANGLTVQLYDAANNLLATTQTAQQNSNNSGYFRFQNLAAGTYRVAIEFPPGYFPTNDTVQERLVTLTVGVDEVLFGYRRFGDNSISGRAYLDLDSDRAFNPQIDSPVGGREVRLELSNGDPAGQTTTAPDGSFSFSGLASGQYRIVLDDPPSGYGGQLEQIIALPDINAHVSVQFALQPDDGRPRVLLFLDSNGNGSPQPGEQRLAGVSVSLYDSACASLPFLPQPVATAITDASGVATFEPELLSGPLGCVFAAKLPPGVGPASPGGTAIAADGSIAWLPLHTLGSLTVQPFLDLNGNNQWNPDEPILQGFTVSVSGHPQLGLTGPEGVTFNLGAGSYSVNVTPSSGAYQMAGSLPATAVISQGSASTLRLPVRAAGGISGQVLTGNATGGWPGLLVELRNVDTQQTLTRLTGGDYRFSFDNLPSGLYQLRLLDLPADHLPGEAPLVNYSVGQATQQNLYVYQAGAVDGIVYRDDNYNGQRDAAEPGTGAYGLVLLNNAGLPQQTIQPASNGSFTLSGLQAGVLYALTLDADTGDGGLGTAVSEAPGWFTLGSQPLNLRVGLYHVPFIDDKFTLSRYYGLVHTGSGIYKTPVAGARIIAYVWNSTHPAADGCAQANPVVSAEAFTDSDGRYRMFAPFLPDLRYCLAVVDTPGVIQTSAAIVKAYGGWVTTGDQFFYQPAVLPRDIPLSLDFGAPAGAGLRGEAAAVSWSAFLDLNGNGEWDGDETGIAGVEIAVDGLTAVSSPDGSGQLFSLPAGEHRVSIMPPEGYAVIGPTERTVHLNGTDLALPPIALRLRGILSGSVFADNDGDGFQGVGGNERGIGGVTVNLSGPTSGSVVSDLSGRFQLAGLPDGIYQVSVDALPGFAAPPPRSVVLADGASLSIPLAPLGLVTGVVYQDWDGDGRRGADEPLLFEPAIAGLGEIESVLSGGQFLIWNPPVGAQTLTILADGVADMDLNVGPNQINTLALPAWPRREVRGTLWHDLNGDGQRQPWESPLAGIAVGLGERTELSDAQGRFRFMDIEPGEYTLEVALPTGLRAGTVTVTVEAHRGAVVGVAARAADRIFHDAFIAPPQGQ